MAGFSTGLLGSIWNASDFAICTNPCPSVCFGLPSGRSSCHWFFGYCLANNEGTHTNRSTLHGISYYRRPPCRRLVCRELGSWRAAPGSVGSLRLAGSKSGHVFRDPFRCLGTHVNSESMGQVSPTRGFLGVGWMARISRARGVPMIPEKGAPAASHPASRPVGDRACSLGDLFWMTARKARIRQFRCPFVTSDTRVF